ncbi:hypothetical protein BpHYR1_022439 [Brachionus plicatilis]|uniref:Uncharacterized protein n=1 Tax=Brachionus plicatilis TaxID=10195 RepID=A0A3M7SN41_BRAPC|nr:hypothetical protein BpHYR1_022439 [Brachionus plicatilis]
MYKIDILFSFMSMIMMNIALNLINEQSRKNWIYERTFDDQEASKDWLDNEKIWSSLKRSETEAGLRVDYRCNLVKRKEPQCAAAIYLLYKSENLSVALFKTKEQHNHDEIANTGHGINKETKEYIEDLLEKGVQLPLTFSIKLKFHRMYLKEKPFKILQFDKNFGTFLISIKDFFQLANEHLENTETYFKLESGQLLDTEIKQNFELKFIKDCCFGVKCPQTWGCRDTRECTEEVFKTSS